MHATKNIMKFLINQQEKLIMRNHSYMLLCALMKFCLFIMRISAMMIEKDMVSLKTPE